MSVSTIVLTTTRAGAIAAAVVNRGPTGATGPSPSGTGLVSVTSGVLDTPTTLSARVNADAVNLRTQLGLGTAATTAATAYATAAQGSLATTALQPLGVVSADVTDATSDPTASKIVKRGTNGEAGFGSSSNAFNGDGLSGLAYSGYGVLGTSTSGIGVYGISTLGYGVHASSINTTALYVISESGNYHAEFGAAESFIARDSGAYGWIRPNAANDESFTARIQPPSSVEGNRIYTAPDASGTLALTSDLSSYQSTSGTLALGGFSSITGTIAISNIGGLGTGVGTALAETTNSASGFVTRAGLDSRLSQLENYFSILTSSGPSATNTISLVATGCAVTLIPGTYLLESLIFIDNSNSNNGGIRAQIFKSGSGAATGNAQIGLFTANNGTAMETRQSYDYQGGSTNSTASWVMSVKGYVIVTTNNVTLEWYQALNTTDAAVPVRTPIAGTYIKATRIS